FVERPLAPTSAPDPVEPRAGRRGPRRRVRPRRARRRRRGEVRGAVPAARGHVRGEPADGGVVQRQRPRGGQARRRARGQRLGQRGRRGGRAAVPAAVRAGVRAAVRGDGGAGRGGVRRVRRVWAAAEGGECKEGGGGEGV